MLVVSSGNQNTVPAPPGSRETPCSMSAADAHYWFTLWPRKQLIAYAEAAWHLTIRCGERDDWIAHISVMEHPLHCVCVWVCVAVHAYSVSVCHYSAGMVLLVFGFFRCSWLSALWVWLFYSVFMALNWPFSNVIQNVTAVNAGV